MPPNNISGKYVATSYGPPWGGIQGTGVTATGTRLSSDVVQKMEGPYIIAVDPAVIPLGTQVYVWPNPFSYLGTFKADDTGGAIRGRRIDFYDPRGRFMQNDWGRRTVRVELNPIRRRLFENEDLGEGGPIPFGGADTGRGIGSGVLEIVGKLVTNLLSPNFWLQALKIIAGLGLLFLALAKLSGAM